MGMIRIRVIGSRDDADSMLTVLHGIDGIEHVEEIDDLMPTMRMLWAQRLRWSRGAGTDLQAGLKALEIEVSKLRQELTETQERLDFAERLLAQAPETRRVDRER